jgi:restriction system protein
LTGKAEAMDQVEPQEIVRFVRNQTRPSHSQKKGETASETAETIEEVEEAWQIKLHRLLTTELDPAAFERLIQRVLRESGFVQVEVTGRTGDGGIDGKGIAKIHGLLSFHVVFQCKRYKSVVTPSQIRDFRGAMVGRADRGLFITTGTFTREAIKEATRDGAPPIDLMDGDQLAAKLKELGLGVKTSMVERSEVVEEWFRGI